MKAVVLTHPAADASLLAGTLVSLGLEVAEVAEGPSLALTADAWQDVAVILLEWSAPGPEGLAALHLVRGEASLVDVPVVVVTSTEQVGDLEPAFAAGANECLVRPFDSEAVLEKLLLLGVDPEQRRAA